MWRMRCKMTKAATLRGVAALCTAAAIAIGSGPTRAGDDSARILGAEILVVRADLAQIAKPDLPPMHRAGFVKRIDGAVKVIVKPNN